MTRKRWALFSILLLIAGGTVFLYRYPLLHSIQQHLLHSIAGQATVDNRKLLRNTAYSHHWVYGLRGIQRLWPHRVNSLQRLRYLYDEFAGFECDIIFIASNGTLTIGHDQPGDETFGDYLHIDSSRKKLFWLDVKNVKPE